MTYQRIFLTICIVICVIGGLPITRAKKCGTCECTLAAIAGTASTPSSSRSVLQLNCSDSVSSGDYLQQFLPDRESYAGYQIAEVHAEFQRNKIAEIDKFSFKTLTRLNLARNEIRTIVDGAFSKLTALRELDLSYNKLQTLEVDTFHGLINLEILNLFDTKITKLDENVFGELSSLKELNLGHNFLVGELGSDLFSFLNNLEKLSINDNGFTTVHVDSFRNLRALSELDISGNALEKIDDDIFLTLSELNVLDLSRNKLVFLKDDVFTSLNKLVALNLSHNALTRLERSAALSRSLRVVNVGHNQLTELEFLRGEFDEIQEIHAEHNKLASLEFLKDFNKIQVLNVSSNTIASIPLQHYPRLRSLDLSNNTLQTVPALLTAEHLPSLATLRLDMNPIAELRFPVTSHVFQNLSYVSVSRMPDVKQLTASAFASLRGKDPSRRENLEEAAVTTDQEGGVMKRQVKEDSFEKFLGDYNDDEEEEEAESKVEENQQTPIADGAEESPKTANESRDEDDDEEESKTVQSQQTPIADVGDESPKESKDETVTKSTLSKDISEKSPGENTVLPALQHESSESDKTTPSYEEEFQKGEYDNEEYNESNINAYDDNVSGYFYPSYGESVVLNPKEYSEVSEEVKNVNAVENQDTIRTTVDVNHVAAVKVGNLRSEPEAPKRAQDEMGLMMTEKVSCAPGRRLVLKVTDNKNLVNIEADTFKGIDICELDLSHNSLSTVPEAMVDWAAVPYIDLQGNPWDCSCPLQWLLDVIVPKAYVRQPQLLYELRCGAPPMLRDRRFVHFFNWTEPAFCSVHKEQMKNIPLGDDEDAGGIELKLGGSGGMFVVAGVALGLVVLMVGVGIYLQRRVSLKRRNRNRRK